VVTGQVVDANNNGIPDAIVVLIPKNGSKTETAIADQAGIFRFDPAAAPGDYRMLGLVGLSPDEAQDPAKIQQRIGDAMEISLNSGEFKSVTLHVRHGLEDR
jgi:hypothetical protein